MRILSLVVFALLSSPMASAQFDPGERPVAHLLNDVGDIFAQVQFEAVTPGESDGYSFVGEESWEWTTEAWPDESMTLVGGAKTELDVSSEAVFHQAIFPSDADLESIPEGDITYALGWEDGTEVGWLVVHDSGSADSALTWVLAHDVEVDELLIVDAEPVLLEPTDEVPDDGPYRAIAQAGL